ncbi:piggyBac transposable element-derived protein 4-like [Megalobrama amblycephala]|uniref:piggyBac transposable element-derived protein 4-like n=1 Tax=Megalobrama amblycephala TaxID=75352 RepID=UPI002014388D|nr:piggyBac transposable element-derived protein 4-like [Megalobrama amblycephala]XP_048025333.1 piggyBac transposable element-derived protein 4-like [Megalobrama amblycephala]
MARHARERALRMIVDSEEEFSFSSEDDEDVDDEGLHFEEGFDPAQDTFSDENVIPSRAPRREVAHKRRSVFNTVENLNECENDSDQIPVAKRARNSSWKAETDVDINPETLRFLPARKPGPQLSLADSHSPMSLFKLFFSESAVSNLCHNTNAQAARALAKGRKYSWTDVSIGEMYRYIGLVFYMAAVKMSSIADYWRQDSLFSLPLPATVMSRDRYRTISWNLHMSHPDADKENDKKRGTAEHDRLFRIKPLMDTIRLACKAFYHPKRNLAVKERLVACKANFGMTRFTKPKPTKLGFKFYVLSDTSNEYTVDFSVYTGKNSFPTGHGISYDAVMSLLDKKALGSGYHVYMDDFFTSPKLLTDLLAMKFGACGTYRDYRRGFPQSASNSLTKKSTRGSIRWIRDGPLVCVKWMDKKEVSVCSTIHAAYTGDRVQRKVKAQDTWRTKTFPCPSPVIAYNQHMVGADLSDQLLEYFTAQHKTMKWYRKVFLHFLDIAATNAFLLHKELHGNMTHKEFMEQLTAELCGVSQKEALKQTSIDHVPVPGAELTSDVRKIATTGRRICAHCKAVFGKKQQTPWKCQACDVHLCLQLNRNCFQEWHKDLAISEMEKVSIPEASSSGDEDRGTSSKDRTTFLGLSQAKAKRSM